MRTMFDSTTPWEIPRDAEMVAGYVDGRYAWPQEWWDMFPDAVHVTISAIGEKVAHVGDVEVGCIWPPANAVPWVLRARAAGIDPTVYVNEMNDWAPTRAAFDRAGVAHPHWWVANYDGVIEIPAGAVAKQYAHPRDAGRKADAPLHAWETGKHYDASAVADYWPGVDAHAPGGGGTEEEDVYGYGVQELPATTGDDFHEAEVIWPPLSGATGLREAWVSGQVPAGQILEIKFAHWNDADGTRLDGTDGHNYVDDETVIHGAAPLYGKPAPEGAAKLVFVYKASAPVKLAVEVRG